MSLVRIGGDFQPITQRNGGSRAQYFRSRQPLQGELDCRNKNKGQEPNFQFRISLFARLFLRLTCALWISPLPDQTGKVETILKLTIRKSQDILRALELNFDMTEKVHVVLKSWQLSFIN